MLGEGLSEEVTFNMRSRLNITTFNLIRRACPYENQEKKQRP